MNFTPMTYKGRKTHKQRTIVEIVNTVIAAMLMLSPWLFRFSDAADAAWSAALIGLLLGAVTLTRDAEAQDWQSSVTLVLGVYSFLPLGLLGSLMSRTQPECILWRDSWW
jgi:phosphatidylserine synthase